MNQTGYVLLTVMLVSTCIAALLMSSTFIVMNDLKVSYLFREKLLQWDQAVKQ
jgi:hypothetical protein